MPRYLCPSCHDVCEANPGRFAWCTACGGPLTSLDLLPVRPGFTADGDAAPAPAGSAPAASAPPQAID